MVGVARVALAAAVAAEAMVGVAEAMVAVASVLASESGSPLCHGSWLSLRPDHGKCERLSAVAGAAGPAGTAGTDHRFRRKPQRAASWAVCPRTGQPCWASC